MARTTSPASTAQINLLGRLGADLGREVPEGLTVREASALIDQWIPEAKQARFAKAAEARKSLPAWVPEDERTLAALAGWAETAKVTVKGRFVSVKEVEGYQGSTQIKGVFEDEEGRRVWMTVPQKAIDATGHGYGEDFEFVKSLDLTVTVTVEAKKEDPSFGFGKRPSVKKAEIRAESPLAAWIEGEPERELQAEIRRQVARTAPVRCCHHERGDGGHDYHGEGRTCGGTVRVMSDVWERCGCKNERNTWTVRSTNGWNGERVLEDEEVVFGFLLWWFTGR